METEETIRKWAESEFGLAHPHTIAMRALEECVELVKAAVAFKDSDSAQDAQNLLEECADVEICLRYLTSKFGCVMQLIVDRKMQINREREWIPDGHGNGYHVKK